MKKILLITIFLLTVVSHAQAPSISYGSPQIYKVGVPISPLTPTNSGGAVPTTISALVSNFAGSGMQGTLDGTGTAARFYNPIGVAVDLLGNVYVADVSNNQIRKISSDGVVSVFAGSGSIGSTDGPGIEASFHFPYGVAVDAAGTVYVADTYNHKIRKISSTGAVSTLAGSGSPGFANGSGIDASFNNPSGVAVDAQGNVYVADSENHKIRKITAAGIVSTLAGSGSVGSTDGSGIDASFNYPDGLTIDATGTLYVADTFNNKIRKISPAGVVSTFAGSGVEGSADGSATAATFFKPYSLALDAASNVYVCDMANNKIRKISSDGQVSTYAGNGNYGSSNGTALSSSFFFPSGVAADASGNLFVADRFNHKIRKISTVGAYSISPISLPVGLNFEIPTGIISGTPREVTAETNYTVTASNSNGSSSTTVSISCELLQAPSISYDSPHTYSVGVPISPLSPVNVGGAVPATVYKNVSTLSGDIISPVGVVMDKAGNLYIVSQNKIKKISPSGVISDFVGSGSIGATDGAGTAANFYNPLGLAIDAHDNLYVADELNNKIRKVSPLGVVTTLAGSGTMASIDGQGILASFYMPNSLAIDALNNIYVSDMGSRIIRKISPSGAVTSFAGSGRDLTVNGTGLAASFHHVYGLALDKSANLFVCEEYATIRKISPAGVVTTFAGNGSSGSADGIGSEARFNSPIGLTIDKYDNLYVTDTYNYKIRKITPEAVVSTFAGNGLEGLVDGVGANAKFNSAYALLVDPAGAIIVADTGNNKLRKISTTGYEIIPSTLPAGLSFDSTTGIISGTPTVGSASKTYTVTAYNAIGSSAATIVFSASSLGISSFSEIGLISYPKPTHSVLNLSTKEGLRLNKISVIDLSGRMVLEQTQNLSAINVARLANGVYILSAFSEGKEYQEKFIKD